MRRGGLIGSAGLRRLGHRLIHACGMVELQTGCPSLKGLLSPGKQPSLQGRRFCAIVRWSPRALSTEIFQPPTM